MILWLSLGSLVLAAIPALMFARNLWLYRAPDQVAEGAPAAISLLIPARNEEATIGPALEAALGSQRIDLEVLVLDDGSTDRTAEIVDELARQDERIRLLEAPALPDGWCGKQHACWVLSQHASKPLLCFVDADVRLEPAALSRLAAFQRRRQVGLVSGLPRQETETWAEKLVIPLMHFILLGFLPFGRMRRSSDPAYGAGCGQLMLVEREVYREAGGHRALKSSLHDGVQLPRALRRAGHHTDLCDVTGLVRCRMYHSWREVVAGLTKNAHEALAAPPMIVPATLLLFGGQVLPFLLLPLAVTAQGVPALLGPTAVVLAWLPRWLAAWRFRQSWLGALLHPVGVSIFLGIQWKAFLRRRTGKPATWRGRSYN